MSEDTIQMMLDRKVWLVTTLGPLFLQAERGLEHGLSQTVVDRRLRQIAEPGRFTGIQAAVTAGVRHAFGTDAGSPIVPHDEIVGEMTTLVKLGICTDNAAALRSASLRASELLGLSHELGTLDAGKTADVVVVAGDPTADLENLRRIERVYVRGELAVHQGKHVWPRLGSQVPLRLPQVLAQQMERTPKHA